MGIAPERKAKARILVVDDEADVRDAIGKILGNYGYEVACAPDGPEALESFGRSGFDIVMTDLSLPSMSGWEVAKAVRKASPKTPVVLLSGWDIASDDKDFMESGVSRVLPKPVKVKDMIAIITELIPKGTEG